MSELKVAGENVERDEEKIRKELDSLQKDNWVQASVLAFLLPAVIVADYYFLIVCGQDNWVANLLIGILQILFFVRFFPSIGLVFRLIVSAAAGRKDKYFS